MTIHRQADAVEAAWAHAGVTSTVLHCHDYGVSVGQELLARRADGALDVEITAVVWHNGGLYPDLHRQTVGQQLLRDPEHGAEVAAAMTEELFSGGIARDVGDPGPDDRRGDPRDVGRDVAQRAARDGARAAPLHRRPSASTRTGGAAALEGNGLPQTFVWGDLDPVSGAHVMERLVERLPDATMVPLADVGHWPTLEAPDEVVAAVESHRPG